jgi:hypothetical protein
MPGVREARDQCRRIAQWSDRDARTITSRELIELLDKIADRGSPVMANRTANISSQMFM